jgi:hypothetical protein
MRRFPRWKRGASAPRKTLREERASALAQCAGHHLEKVHRRFSPFLMFANATVRATCKEHDEMPQMRSDVGAQHAVPGGDTWHRSAHSARRCRLLAEVRRIVLGERAWRHPVRSGAAVPATSAYLRVTNCDPKIRAIYSTHVPSKFSRNLMKTKERAPYKVTLRFRSMPPGFSSFGDPCR